MNPNAHSTRPRRAVMAAAAMTLFIAACGGGDSEPSAGTASAAEDTQQEADTSQTSEAPAPTDAPPPTEAPETTTTTTTTTTTVPQPAIPEPQFAASPSSDPAGQACVGTRTGLSCLTNDGWTSYTDDDSPIYAWVQAQDMCDDGRLVVPTISGLAVLDGGTWGEVAIDFANGAADSVACSGGEIWAGGFEYVAQLADGQWTPFVAEDVLGQSDFVSSVQHVEIAPDGSVWVATSSSVARFADGAWTVWEEGAGFEGALFVDSLAIETQPDGSYTVLMVARSLYRFDGNEWVSDGGRYNGADALAASAGTVVFPIFRAGITRIVDGIGTELGTEAGISSNTVRDVAIDDGGRLWLATSYGVTVMDGDDVRTYRVDNSGLLDNNTYSVSVFGGGPDLPADAPEERGALAGVFFDELGSPLEGLTVEVCVENLDDTFEGATPCDGQPFVASTTTDETGRFEFLDLPAGEYSLSVLKPNGSWTYFTSTSASARFPATQGGINEIGAITLEENPEG